MTTGKLPLTQDAADALVSGDLRHRLATAVSAGTPGERAIAHFLLTNLQTLPFETAATIAQKVDVSEASVGRFCRAIGYRHLKDLKGGLQADLGDRAWLIGDRLEEFHRSSREGKNQTDLQCPAGQAGPKTGACCYRVFHMQQTEAFGK